MTNRFFFHWSIAFLLSMSLTSSVYAQSKDSSDKSTLDLDPILNLELSAPSPHCDSLLRAMDQNLGKCEATDGDLGFLECVGVVVVNLWADCAAKLTGESRRSISTLVSYISQQTGSDSQSNGGPCFETSRKDQIFEPSSPRKPEHSEGSETQECTKCYDGHGDPLVAQDCKPDRCTKDSDSPKVKVNQCPYDASSSAACLPIETEIDAPTYCAKTSARNGTKGCESKKLFDVYNYPSCRYCYIKLESAPWTKYVCISNGEPVVIEPPPAKCTYRPREDGTYLDFNCEHDGLTQPDGCYGDCSLKLKKWQGNQCIETDEAVVGGGGTCHLEA